MTLRELLKDQTLPVRVRVRNKGWPKDFWFEVRYIVGDKAYGHDSTGSGDYHYLVENYREEWALVESPKPRLLAWRYKSHFSSPAKGDLIVLIPEDKKIDTTDLERCPWLDSPDQEGEG